MENKRVIIVGGGAAGFFAAANASMLAPQHSYTILEQSPNVLGKVKISGGGRCNVTHACFEPRELTKAYPRGNKALMGPFTRFMTGDVMGWFEDRGVALKIEDDGRVFPVSDQSQSIIDCLTQAVRQHGVKVETRQAVQDLSLEGDQWRIKNKGKGTGSRCCVVGYGQQQIYMAEIGANGTYDCPTCTFSFLLSISKTIESKVCRAFLLSRPT